MSAEGRQRVAEAQRARWAKLKKAAKKAARALVATPQKKAVVKKSAKKAIKNTSVRQAPANSIEAAA